MSDISFAKAVFKDQMVSKKSESTSSGSVSWVSDTVSCDQMDKFSQDCISHLASELMENIPIQPHTRNFIKHRACFTGKQVVDWIVQYGRALNRAEAVLQGKLLCKMNFVKPVAQNHEFKDSRALYRFNELQVSKPVPRRSGLALVAHDNMKSILLSWVRQNREELSRHTLYATGTTGSIISKATGLDIGLLKSGPFGGDQQIGAMIAEKTIETLVFFWDPLTAQPHDSDVKALLRIAVMYDTTIAMNVASANCLFPPESPMVSNA